MAELSSRIGFMQGRLSPPVGGWIQAFPREHWRREFELAERHGFRLMEWTLDADGLEDNPLMRPEGRREIRQLSDRHGVTVASLTGDCFMQAPFWRAAGNERDRRLAMLFAVVDACRDLGTTLIVVPLVDNGSLKTPVEADDVVDTLVADEKRLRGIRIAFESDLPPPELARFIARFPERTFGINYDIGNSASLGYDSAVEIPTYAGRIVNVHVKDRRLGGTTVPLGAGNADLPATLARVKGSGYAGNYILQTARAADGDDVGAAVRYRDMTLAWLGG